MLQKVVYTKNTAYIFSCGKGGTLLGNFFRFGALYGSLYMWLTLSYFRKRKRELPMNYYNLDCHYGRCWLPKDNSKYGWQMVFLVFSLFVLWKDVESFPFFPIFLFSAPVMIDILTTELNSKVCTVIRKLFGIGNAIVIVFCFFGFGDIILDNGDYFAFASTSMLLGQVSIRKTYIGIALALDILVPLVFFIGAPSQKTLHMLEVDKRMTEGRGDKTQMNWIGWLFLVAVIVYIGNVLGCMVLCETIPGMDSVKKYAWMVPILNLVLFFSFLYDALLDKSRFKYFRKFIKMPQKSMFALKSMDYSIKEETVENNQYRQFHTRKKQREQRIAIFTGTFRYCGRALSTERIV